MEKKRKNQFQQEMLCQASSHLVKPQIFEMIFPAVCIILNIKRCATSFKFSSVCGKHAEFSKLADWCMKINSLDVKNSVEI